MDDQTLLTVLLTLAMAAATLGAGSWAYPRLKRDKQGYPYEDDIEAAILPFVYQAVLGAYRLSERAVDEAQRRMSGVDKKQIADDMYARLPAKLGSVPIKAWVSREQFATRVQDAFDEFDSFFLQFQGHFDRAFEDWASDTGPQVMETARGGEL